MEARPHRDQAGDVGAMVKRFGRRRLAGVGSVVFRTGDPARTMFLVEAGTVRLELEDGARTVRLGPGETFGELALVLPGHRRTGTAVAETPVVLRELSRESLERVLREDAAAAFALLSRSAATLLESERRLVASLRRRAAELDTALRNLRRITAELDAAERTALTDPLTALYNRRAMERHLDLLSADTDGRGAAILLVDLDHFKAINDTHGHAAGDRALCHLAAILVRITRSSDLPFRLGGDEFAVIAVGSGSAQGRELGSRLLEAVRAQPADLGGHAVRLSLSVGGTVLRPGEPWREALERADRALYAAKDAGRGRLEWRS